MNISNDFIITTFEQQISLFAEVSPNLFLPKTIFHYKNKLK